jgi:aminoglycoside phosphotransferase (APT) family kinase protein
MALHSSLLGISETELRSMIRSLVPSWRDDGLEDFHFLSGGYSNANVVFTRRSADQDAQYVLRIPQRSQPYVNRVAESAWYQRLPASVGISPVALDIPTGLMVSAWVDGELLADVFADRFTESDLLVYLQTLHNALPTVAERYSVPALLSAFVGSGEQSGAVVDALPPVLTQEQQPLQTVTCHNDLNPWNILVTVGGWITLDWEFVGQNDGLFDLVSLHQGLALDVESLPDLASNWAQVTGANYSGERLSRAFGQFWLREWGWATFQMNAGNRREEVSAQASVAEAVLANLPQF